MVKKGPLPPSCVLFKNLKKSWAALELGQFRCCNTEALFWRAPLFLTFCWLIAKFLSEVRLQPSWSVTASHGVSAVCVWLSRLKCRFIVWRPREPHYRTCGGISIQCKTSTSRIVASNKELFHTPSRPLLIQIQGPRAIFQDQQIEQFLSQFWQKNSCLWPFQKSLWTLWLQSRKIHWSLLHSFQCVRLAQPRWQKQKKNNKKTRLFGKKKQ